MQTRRRKKRKDFEIGDFFAPSMGNDCDQRGLSIAIFSSASSIAKTSLKKGEERLRKKKDAFKSNVYQHFAPSPAKPAASSSWPPLILEEICIRGNDKCKRRRKRRKTGLFWRWLDYNPVDPPLFFIQLSPPPLHFSFNMLFSTPEDLLMKPGKIAWNRARERLDFFP